MAKLYVIATPIGNKEDLSLRAQKLLKSVSLIVSESPLASTKLLKPLGVTAKLVPLIVKAKNFNIKTILDTLVADQDVALISEAGTPGINDPGGQVVAQVRQADFAVMAIPGANAAIAAASISGFPLDEFVFKGFVPHKKGRETFFREITEIESAVIFYESPHRFKKTMAVLNETMPQRFLMVARELTKLYEQSVVGKVSKLAALDEQTLPVKGEFVLVLAPKKFSLQAPETKQVDQAKKS